MRLEIPRISATAGVMLLLLNGPASAAKLVPLHTRSDLKGTLTFYSTDGARQFRCKVRLVLFTDKGGENNLKPPMVKSAVGENCPRLFFFESLPWQAAGSRDGVTATVFPFGWAEQGGPSCNETQGFLVDKSGVWTATNGCVTGSLTSDPPITIKP